MMAMMTIRNPILPWTLPMDEWPFSTSHCMVAAKPLMTVSRKIHQRTRVALLRFFSKSYEPVAESIMEVYMTD